MRSQGSYSSQPKKRESKGFDHRTNFAPRAPTGKKLYESDICSKRFTDRSALNQHIKIHTGEQPYECDTCSKQFKHNSALKKHMIVHTDERPYECDICSRHF